MGRTQGGSTPRYICRGCAGYADQSGYRIRYRSGLHTGFKADRGHRRRSSDRRHTKNSKSFLAAVQIRCIALWARIS